MKKSFIPTLLLVLALPLAVLAANTTSSIDSDAYLNHSADFVPTGDAKAQLGRDIWIKATAGNARFFAYVFPQRVSGKSINWPDMLLSTKKRQRFQKYGLINDPDCCSPSEPGECKKKFGREISVEETYGFDYCPGDRELLAFVGKNGYRDPACDIDQNPKYQSITDKNAQSSCDLEFGTSTGTVGLRKFPNPRFNKTEWEKAGGWRGYINMDKDASGLVAVDDHSIEPPFRVGMACAHCHAAYLPTNPPMDYNFPTWENINSLVGNQYLMAGQIWASGFRKDHINMQSLAMSRPGTVDTSAVPNDFIGNPGTQNLIANLPRRPLFEELVVGWRKAATCEGDKDERSCWCEPGKSGKCWKKSLSKEPESVPHILKGGEDSVGYLPAIQRVYFNIGSCSEQCWLNNLSAVFSTINSERNYGETPFDIGQCRRDCPNFRAIEDRVESIGQFLFSSRPADLKDAKDEQGKPLFVDEKGQAGSRDSLVKWLEERYGSNSVRSGAKVFAVMCANCHSSQKPPGGGFAALASSFAKPEEFFWREVEDPNFPGQKMRADWLGNDERIESTAIGTNSCRARHSNHMKGSVYEEYGSETYRMQEAVDFPSGRKIAGGPGRYRNISLINLWAYGPFGHSNAIGPEMCGNPDNPRWEYASTVDNKKLNCEPFNPSVMARFKIYEESMRELLTPSDKRVAKAMMTTEEMQIELMPKFWDGTHRKGQNSSLFIQFPKGMNSQWIGSFRAKEFIDDFRRHLSLDPSLRDSLQKRFGNADQILAMFKQTEWNFVVGKMVGSIELDPERLKFYLQTYSNCFETADNLGHDFGTNLNESEKNALIAFLATL